MLSIFETSGKENICTDIDTFLELLYLLSDEGVLGSMTGGEGGEGSEESDMVKILTKADANGKTVISRAIDILNANERTKFIVTSLTKITLSTMTQQMGGITGEQAEQLYEEVKSGLTDVVNIKKDDYETEEEYKNAVLTAIEKEKQSHE